MSIAMWVFCPKLCRLKAEPITKLKHNQQNRTFVHTRKHQRWITVILQQAENAHQKIQHVAFTLFSCSCLTAKFKVKRTKIKQNICYLGISLPTI